jgi:hypothetical protein
MNTGGAASSNPDRRARPLHRLQRHLGAIETEMLPLTTHLIFSPQTLEQRQGFLKTRHTRGSVHPKHRVFDVAIPQPHAAHQSSIADDVKGGELFGQVDRIIQRQEQDIGDQRHFPRLSGDAR